MDYVERMEQMELVQLMRLVTSEILSLSLFDKFTEDAAEL